MGAALEHVKRRLELWNDAAFDELLNDWAPDGVDEGPTGTFTGTKAIRERYQRDLTTFPDRRLTALCWAENGDTVFLEGEWTGTLSAPLSLPDGTQVPPTGERLTVRLVNIYEVRDGKTVALHSYWDQLPTLMQLGVVAPTQRP